MKYSLASLGDVLEKIIGGGTPSKENKDYWNGSIPWCSVKDMKEGSYRIKKTEDFITEIGLKNSASNLIPKNTVITSTRMGLGRAFLSSVDMAINQDLKALIPNSKIDKIFLLWSIIFQKDIIEGLGTGATVKGIRLETLKSIKIPLPPLPTQKKIAGILSAYDDAIENNLRRIKLLEEMAQITYEEWFVRLRFPGHESTPINEATGLPEGWEKEKVGNVLSKIKTTKKIQNSEFLPKGLIPIVDQSRDFIAGYTDEPEALLNMDQPLIIFGDHTRILKFINFPFARGADGTQVLLSKEPRMPQHLFYLSLIAVDLSNYHYARHFKFLKDSEIILPSKEVADEFEKYSNDKFTLIRELRNQNQHLREARDILLPRLMTGVIDAEKYQPENLLKEIL